MSDRGALTIKDACGNCQKLQRRDPNAPWPIAGVATGAAGRCVLKSVNNFQPWRSETDWCPSHVKMKS